jgi:hypothetical protein
MVEAAKQPENEERSLDFACDPNRAAKPTPLGMTAKSNCAKSKVTKNGAITKTNAVE